MEEAGREIGLILKKKSLNFHMHISMLDFSHNILLSIHNFSPVTILYYSITIFQPEEIDEVVDVEADLEVDVVVDLEEEEVVVVVEEEAEVDLETEDVDVEVEEVCISSNNLVWEIHDINCFKTLFIYKFPRILHILKWPIYVDKYFSSLETELRSRETSNLVSS